MEPRRRLRRAVLLALVLTVPALVVEPSAAQDTPETPSEVPRVIANRFDVLEGDGFQIFASGFALGDKVKVQCQLCPDPVVYMANANYALAFPDDFGPEAIAKREPRWNATYKIELMRAGAVRYPLPSAEWNVNATTVDLWKFPEPEVEPNDRIRIQSSGYTLQSAQGAVRIKLTRENKTFPTRRDTIFEWPPLTPVNGTVAATFRFSYNMAALVRCPEDPIERCRMLRVEISGGGKNTEIYNFAARPAQIVPKPDDEPSPGDVPGQYNRTLTVRATFQLPYRSGFEFLTFLDYGFNRGPRYHVERILADTKVNVSVVHSGQAKWSDDSFGWAINWTIPRDAPLKDPQTGVPYQYRFVVPKQEDPYRNDILRHDFNPFIVTAYVIPLAFEEAPVVVQRTEKAVWKLSLRYADGKPFTAADNNTQLRFCVFPKSEARPNLPCLNRPTIELRHTGKDLWAVTNQWPIDEPRVVQDWAIAASWNGASNVGDKHGNTVNGGEMLYNLSVAKPRIALLTDVGGERREGQRPFERGDLVKVVAKIVYPDGKTPFNRTRNAEGSTLPMFVVQKNSLGDVVSIRTVNLSNPDNTETWVGQFQVGKTAEEAPTGRWDLKFDVKDKVRTPNVNATQLVRNVVAASILVTTSREPPLTARIGDTVQYRFRLNYRDAREVTGESIGFSVRAEVRPWKDGKAGSPIETLAPVWDPVRRDWFVDWSIPRHLLLQQYIMVPSGSDLSGNPVRGDVHSRPVLLTTETLQRGIITQPPLRVPRGEKITAIFDGRDGDVGVDGKGKPAIQVQRFDASAQKWFVEYLNVRAGNEPGIEHVALWNTTLQTHAGTYRFVLVGKDAQFAFIEAASREFILQTIKVSRESLSNGTHVLKGGKITAVVERKPGDTIQEAYVVQDGKRFETIANRRAETDRAIAEWTVPFTFPTGAFTVVIKMFDRNQNEAYGEVGPFFVSGATIRSDAVVDPVRIVARGAEADWRFRSFYPSGQKLTGPNGFPEVTVFNATGPVARAKVGTDGPNYVVKWEVPKDGGLVDHWFEVGGKDGYGNDFLTIRSDAFRVEPGVIGRIISLLPPPYNPRDVLTGFRVYTDPDDKVLEYVIVKLRADDATGALNNFQGQVVARGDVKPNEDGTQWFAEWRPAKDTPLGWYRFRIQGADLYGNRIEQYSGAFQITPSQLAVEFFSQSREMVPGEAFEATFRVRYPDQSLLDDKRGRVTAQMARDGVPVAPEPTTAWDGNRWTAIWETPDPLDHGKYVLIISGFDLLGNTVIRTGTSSIDYAPSNLEKLLGVPAPGLPMALLAIAALALAFRRRT